MPRRPLSPTVILQWIVIVAGLIFLRTADVVPSPWSHGISVLLFAWGAVLLSTRMRPLRP